LLVELLAALGCNWFWRLTGSSSLDRTVTLPNGTYTLSVWVKSSATGAQLYAKLGPDFPPFWRGG
jgi:hypothetical protein